MREKDRRARNLPLSLLLLLVSVIPGVFLWSTADQRLTQAWLGEERQLEQYLQKKVFDLQAEMEPEAVLRNLAGFLARLPPASIQRTIGNLEKAYPGSFKWVAWNDHGILLNLKGPIFPGTRVWQSIITHGFLRPPGLGDPNREQAYEQASKLIHTLFGKGFPAGEFLESPSRVFETEVFGEPSMAMWVRGARGPARRPAGGVLVLLHLRRIPDRFWVGMGARFSLSRTRGASCRAVLVPIGDAPRSAFQEELYQGLRNTTAEVFRSGEWLCQDVNPPLPRILPWRVVLLVSHGSLLAVFADLRTALAFILFLATGLTFYLVQKMVFSTLHFASLRRRVGFFFLVALALPVFLVGAFTLHLSAFEERKAMREMGKQLTRESQTFSTGFSLFNLVYGEMFRTLQGTFARTQDLTVLRQDLEQMRREKRISGFFESSPEGEVAFFSHSTKGEEALPLFRSILRNQQSKYSTDPAWMAAKSGYLYLPGSLRLYDFASTRTYLQFLLVKTDEKYVAFVVEVEIGILERAWFQAQQAGRFARKAEEGIFLLDVQPHGILPANPLSRALLLGGFRDQILSSAAAGGEMPTTLGQYVYHYTAQEFESIHPVFLAALEPHFQRIRDRRNGIFLLLLISVLAAGLLGLLLGETLLMPLTRLGQGIRSFKNKGGDTELPEEGNNEVSLMNRQFNKMTRDLRERDQLRRFLSATVLEAVKDGAGGRFQHGERTVCTVWFSHIHGFQQIVQDHPPAEVFQMLNEYLAGIERCLRGFGGEVDKFIDDGVMAVFPGPNRETDAARASWAVAQFLRRFNRERQERHQFPVSAGIGINTGPVIIGNLGSRQRKDLTVIGDPVNLAARLEAASSRGSHSGIMVSEGVAAAITPVFRCEETGIRAVKGKSGELRIFEIREERS